MDDALLMRVLNRLTNLDKKLQADPPSSVNVGRSIR